MAAAAAARLLLANEQASWQTGYLARRDEGYHSLSNGGIDA